jgi:NTF2 fold immunity protein
MRRVPSIAATIAGTLCVILTHAAQGKPKDLVPDAATAIKIAVAVWEPLYGASQIAQEKPYRAYLKGDVWVVTGTLPQNAVGGVAQAQIAKKDGCITSVFHGE